MGSVPPDSFLSQQDGNAFPVKTEYSGLENHHQLHSSEEDSGNGSENRASRDGFYSAGGSHGGGEPGFAQANLGQSSGSSTHPSMTALAKDPLPISKRTMQNRKAQREFRQRRATYLKDLEAKVRRFEAGESASGHREAQQRIGHLVHEIRYLRAIVDQLQQENAELRRSEAFPSPQQSLPPAGPASSYTLHPAYPPTTIEPPPESYTGNALALGEVSRPAIYPASFPGGALNQESKFQHPSYSLPSPASSHLQSQHQIQSTSPRAYQPQLQMDWPAVRHSSGNDRPETVPIDSAAPTAIPHNEHDPTGSSHSYLFHPPHQGTYYQTSSRPPTITADDSAHSIHDQVSHSHSTSPSSAETSNAGSMSNPYSRYGPSQTRMNTQSHSGAQRPLAVVGSTPAWHNTSTPHMNFHPPGQGPPPPQDDPHEYQYQYRQLQHPHNTQAPCSDHSRSLSLSPVVDGLRNTSGAILT